MFTRFKLGISCISHFHRLRISFNFNHFNIKLNNSIGISISSEWLFDDGKLNALTFLMSKDLIQFIQHFVKTILVNKMCKS